MTATVTTPDALKPQAGPQTAFLTSPADICIYGGAAGGGKSWGILFECIRHVTTNPRFGAVVFRRQSTQIKNEGGLWDEAGQMYPQLGGTMKIGDLEYHWPDGGKISFRHLQHEATKFSWQGSQIPLICFDELTHFTESQFFYMLSRNRSMCGIRPYIRGTTNPDAGSWVKRFIGPWVDRKHALYPQPSGKILFMVRVKGQIKYYLTREACLAENKGARPKTVTFIKASVFDNQKLLEKDPDYLANLEAQSAVERARLLDGDWDIVNEGLVYPAFGTCVVESEEWPDFDNLPALSHTGGLDWGWNDPLAGVRAKIDHEDVLWIDWTHYQSRKTLTKFCDELTELNRAISLPNRPRWWGDPSGATQIAELRLKGHDVIACVHLGQQPLKAGITIVTERIEQGRLKVHGALADLIEEAKKYRYPEPGKGNSEVPVDADNHLMDALRYMIVGHDRGRVVQGEELGETEDEANARELAEAEALAEAQKEFRNVNNDHWWN